jgi:hypothetical protein
MTPSSEKSSAVLMQGRIPSGHFTSGELNMEHHDDKGIAGQPLRLLIPITAAENSRWGVQYALRLKEQGRRIEVIFLNVGEIITDWQVLRFRTQAEMARFQSERAQSFIDEASSPLLAHDIPFRGLFKRGDPVFCILDTAEELDCQQIIMPPPSGGVCGIFSKNVTGILMKKTHAARIITVDQDGRSADTGKKPSS